MPTSSCAEPSLRYGVIAAVAVLLAIGANWTWSRWQARAELLALPTIERHMLYERTLETLNGVCKHAHGNDLSDYCREQVRFISRFPECDDACQTTCRQLSPRPTR
jgi:cytochrome b pre-mRNA-processing protein 3